MIKPKILVIDDDKHFLKSFTKHLNSERYQIFKARSPEEARKILERHLIHLAIVDIRLRQPNNPNDRSGLYFCKEMDPAVARIILTRFTDMTDTWELVREASMPTENRYRAADGFFSKQADLELVEDEIQRVLSDEFEIIPERRIAVLTSGGDAPGMNAAIWAIVRTAMNSGVEVMGVQDGYLGLVEDKMRKLKWEEVSDIIEKSGTILGTARFDKFKEQSVRRKAVDNIKRRHISNLIVIGGDGSMMGAHALAKDLQNERMRFRTVVIPGTIDNDLWGTDMSLGAASAANAMIGEMRNMIQPARALRRIFVCEVMGASCGYLALQAALGVGADAVIMPEQIIEVLDETEQSNGSEWKDCIDVIRTEESYRKELETIAKRLMGGFAANKRYGFIVVAEGIKLLTKKGGDHLSPDYVMKYLTSAIKKWSQPSKPDVRVQELGYTVRGVPPSQFDVWLGAKLGASAVQSLLKGKSNCMIGWEEKRGIVKTPFETVVTKSNRPPKEIWRSRPAWQELFELQQSLACPPPMRIGGMYVEASR